MAAQNPNKHARVAADALCRLVQDVRSGRAAWEHLQTLRQGVDDLIRAADALAAAAQQMTVARAGMTSTVPVPHGPDAADRALHQVGQAAATAAAQLRQARRALR
ncbi:hypothetical protein [Streptomyces spirodelae]|uniref:Uncharacterized protein n=1 Tax=Streptomyces spirodelae TaxID=2812904 RepID=A0ABS3X1C9_9ACTN|nr:hypothetical protein [Streptomyces spirodelae]MBO8189190.1 hypothetical protein [Streptomyces spirodelae]